MLNIQIGDAKLFEGKTFVVFENLYVNNKLVREHERFDDEKQTVHFPNYLPPTRLGLYEIIISMLRP